MHDPDRHFRLEKFFVNCWASAAKNKNLVTIALPLCFRRQYCATAFLQAAAEKLFAALIESLHARKKTAAMSSDENTRAEFRRVK